jgi:hypothetical protein
MAARSAARARRAQAREPRLVPGGVVLEALGLSLLGVGGLAALALATYHPEDPAFALVPVKNAAGAVGATLAAALSGGLGSGASVLVAGLLVLGGRLLLGRQLPRLVSRFWIAGALLLAAGSTLPPLLHEVAPGRFAFGHGGALGTRLAVLETLFLKVPGSLVLNGLLLAVGGLGLFGISLGAALRALGAAGAAVGRLAGRSRPSACGASSVPDAPGSRPCATSPRIPAPPTSCWRTPSARRSARCAAAAAAAGLRRTSWTTAPRSATSPNRRSSPSRTDATRGPTNCRT